MLPLNKSLYRPKSWTKLVAVNGTARADVQFVSRLSFIKYSASDFKLEMRMIDDFFSITLKQVDQNGLNFCQRIH